jgi:hypothetical protein
VAQDGAGELGAEALDEVEPGAMLGREGKLDAAYRSCVEPGAGFSRDVCGMIVEATPIPQDSIPRNDPAPKSPPYNAGRGSSVPQYLASTYGRRQDTRMFLSGG